MYLYLWKKYKNVVFIYISVSSEEYKNVVFNCVSVFREEFKNVVFIYVSVSRDEYKNVVFINVSVSREEYKNVVSNYVSVSREEYKNVVFIYVSDDMTWAKENILPRIRTEDLYLAGSLVNPDLRYTYTLQVYTEIIQRLQLDNTETTGW